MGPHRNIVIRQRVEADKIQLAKELRRNLTPAERKLWEAVRRNQIDGIHFRRQQIIAGFIVDFYCHRARLAIEIDGEVHEHQVDYDLQRDEALRQHDIRVVHFTNDEVMRSLGHVIERIRVLCR